VSEHDGLLRGCAVDGDHWCRWCHAVQSLSMAVQRPIGYQ
jgi:hypothetical protein